MIKLLLVDMQYLTRAGLSSLIRSCAGLELVGEIENTRELLPFVRDTRADILLIDYQYGDIKDYSIIEKVKKESPDTEILVITEDDDQIRIHQVIGLGVKGFLTKTCDQQEIIHAIHSVAKGKRYFCNKILELVVENKLENNEELRDSALSPRENEVLRLIAKGFSTLCIANELHVSVHTVNSHRKNILKKLKLKSPAQLIVYALEKGLV